MVGMLEGCCGELLGAKFLLRETEYGKFSEVATYAVATVRGKGDFDMREKRCGCVCPCGCKSQAICLRCAKRLGLIW